MTNLADQVIAALRSGHDDLSAYAEHLQEPDLRGPSGASEWPVSQVLSHLGSGAEIGLATLERALSGGGRAPEGFNQSVWDRWNAMPPLEHRDSFIEANRRLVERYESLDAQTREELRIDLGWLPAPVSVADAGRQRLLEFTLHTWDAKVIAHPDTTLAPQAVPLLLDTAAGLLGWIAKPTGVRADLAVDLDDRSLGLFLGDTVSLGARPSQPDGVLRLPSEAWLRLLAGRLRTPVSLTGPVSLDELRQIFPGY